MLKVNTCKRNICSDRESQSLYIFYYKSITEVFMRLFSQHCHSSQGCSLGPPRPLILSDVTGCHPLRCHRDDSVTETGSVRSEGRTGLHSLNTQDESELWVNTSRHQNVHHGLLRDTHEVILTFLSELGSYAVHFWKMFAKHGWILVVGWPPVTARVCPC